MNRICLRVRSGRCSCGMITCGGFGDWAFGALRDKHVPLNLIFGAFAGVRLNWGK